MNDDPNKNSGLKEALKPAVKAMVELTEERMEEAIAPLLAQIAGLEVMVMDQAARLAVLEAQMASLTDESKA